MQQEDTYLAALAKRSQLFDGIGTDNLSALFSCLGARRVRLAKGELLLRTGEKADRFGIVLSGSLAVSTYDTDGKRTLIKLIKAPEVVAAAQALSGADVISVDVEANEDSVVLLLKAARIVTPCENACAFHARLVEFDIPFDRQQLADYLCVERSALSAEISRLSKLGLITSRKSHFALRRTV